MSRRHAKRSLSLALSLAFALVWPASVDAQRKPRRSKPAASKPEASKPRPADDASKPNAADERDTPGKPGGKRGRGKEQVFDFTGLELQGAMRTPQLLYFLERASQELDRASLERRSFVPEMLRSIEEERL